MTLAPDDEWIYHPQYVQRFTDTNKLYIVASCWTIIRIYFTSHGPLNVKQKPRIPYTETFNLNTFVTVRMFFLDLKTFTSVEAFQVTRCTVQLSFISRYLKRLVFIDGLKDGSINFPETSAIICHSIRHHTPNPLKLLVVSVF